MHGDQVVATQPIFFFQKLGILYGRLWEVKCPIIGHYMYLLKEPVTEESHNCVGKHSWVSEFKFPLIMWNIKGNLRLSFLSLEVYQL